MQMETRRTEELKPHQASRDIYGKNEYIADLAASIRANGVLVLFTAKPEGTFLSGSRPSCDVFQMGLPVLFASCHERNRQQGQGRETGAAAARTAVPCRRVRRDRRCPRNSKHQYLGGAACGICRL